MIFMDEEHDVPRVKARPCTRNPKPIIDREYLRAHLLEGMETTEWNADKKCFVERLSQKTERKII